VTAASRVAPKLWSADDDDDDEDDDDVDDKSDDDDDGAQFVGIAHAAGRDLLTRCCRRWDRRWRSEAVRFRRERFLAVLER